MCEIEEGRVVCPHCHAELANANDPYSSGNLECDEDIDLYEDGFYENVTCPECGKRFDLDVEHKLVYCTYEVGKKDGGDA